MGKGDETRRVILQQALELASQVGLEGLTIGALAKRVGMSKSGLYAHFDSKEGLQCAVLDAAAALFADVVLRPAFQKPRGLPRLQAVFERWLRWETHALSGGCPFITAAAEFDDRPGQVRDRVVGHLREFTGTLARAARLAVAEGHFRAGVDCDQFAFATWSLLLGYQHYSRLLGDEAARNRVLRAFDSLLDHATAGVTRSGGDQM